MIQGSFIAVDWGTTNRRAYLIEADGTVARHERDAGGVTAIRPGGFADEAAAIRGRLGDLPMLCAGMVGSDRGWAKAPYIACPAGLDELAGALHWIEPGRTAILPGVSLLEHGRADVMRGEEVQLLGAAAAGLVPQDALLCQPGTHCKWAELAAGRIRRFTTAMTGELFALLKGHSLLAGLLGGTVAADAAFLEGVAAARRDDLLAGLFELRAQVLLGRRPPDQGAAYASGLLIGSDVAARPIGGSVHVLAEPGLGGLYRAAIEALGGRAVPVDVEQAFIRGMVEIRERCR